MKRFFTILMAGCFALTAAAQTAVVVLNDTAEYNLNGVTKKTFNLEKPCSRLTVNAKHTASTLSANPTGTLVIEQYVNGSWQKVYDAQPGVVTLADRVVLGQKVGQYEASVGYEAISVNLNYRATELRFTGNALNNKQIQNLTVYMASFVEALPATLDFGEMVVWTEPVTKAMSVEYCNVNNLTVRSTNPDFVPAVSTITCGIAQYNTASVDVTFTPNIRGEHTGTIIVTNGQQTDSIHVRAKVTKRTPIFTAEVLEMTVGDVLETPVTSDCSNQMMIATCGDVLSVSCGHVKALAEGEATITVMQLGDEDYWNNKVEEFTISVSPAPVVPTSVESAPEQLTPQQVREAQKFMHDGQTIISYEGRMYNAEGKLVK